MSLIGRRAQTKLTPFGRKMNRALAKTPNMRWHGQPRIGPIGELNASAPRTAWSWDGHVRGYRRMRPSSAGAFAEAVQEVSRYMLAFTVAISHIVLSVVKTQTLLLNLKAVKARLIR